MLADSAFQPESSQLVLSKYGIQIRPLPPRRHEHKMIRSLHSVIRSIFIRPRHSNKTGSAAVLAFQSVRVSNNLFRNDRLC